VYYTQLDERVPVVNTKEMGNRSPLYPKRKHPMRCNRLAVIVGLACWLTFLEGAQAGQEQVGPWTVNTDNNARIISMSYPNPPTGLGNVQALELDIGTNATATRGRLTFKDGVKRDMTKEEVTFYYSSLKGPKAAWDYLDAKKQVTKYAPDTTALPEKLAGHYVRVIVKEGLNFFGTLAFEPAKPGGFILAVQGASGGPIRFENNIVREVQVAK
jgi:hypothetical protein